MDPETKHFWTASFGKRAKEELYQISRDPACMDNLVLHPEYQDIKAELKDQLFEKLKAQGDPTNNSKNNFEPQRKTILKILYF